MNGTENRLRTKPGCGGPGTNVWNSAQSGETTIAYRDSSEDGKTTVEPGEIWLGLDRCRLADGGANKTTQTPGSEGAETMRWIDDADSIGNVDFTTRRRANGRVLDFTLNTKIRTWGCALLR